MERPKELRSSISIYRGKIKEEYRESYVPIRVHVFIDEKDIVKILVEGPEGDKEIAYLESIQLVSP